MCGNPVIGFSVRGIKDIIIDNFNGILFENISAESLKDAVDKYFKNSEKFNRVKIRKDAVSRYDINVCEDNYIKEFINYKSEAN